MSRFLDKHPPKTVKEAAGLSHSANHLVSRIHARLMTAKWFDTPERLARLGIGAKKGGEHLTIKEKELNQNENIISNNESEFIGKHRIEIAKKYEGQFKYSLDREEGTTNCADFITMIMLTTDKEIASHFVNTKNTSYSDVSTMRNAILNSLGGQIRKGNPKTGDIAIWWNGSTGHVEFVSSVSQKDGKTYFTTFGAGSKKTLVPREMGLSKNGYPWIFVGSPDLGGLGQGGVFEGFWTPNNKQ